MKLHTWQYFTNGRRLTVPGGWLYQTVQGLEGLHGETTIWSLPVFVAAHAGADNDNADEESR